MTDTLPAWAMERARAAIRPHVAEAEIHVWRELEEAIASDLVEERERACSALCSLCGETMAVRDEYGGWWHEYEGIKIGCRAYLIREQDND